MGSRGAHAAAASTGSRYFSVSSRLTRLTVFNSSEPAAHAAAADRHLEAAILEQPISNAAAQIFVGQRYSSIAFDVPLSAAFAQALLQVQLAYLPRYRRVGSCPAPRTATAGGPRVRLARARRVDLALAHSAMITLGARGCRSAVLSRALAAPVPIGYTLRCPTAR